jgi:hypothetical protein
MPPASTYLDYDRSPDHMQDGDPIGQREMMELTGRSLKAIYKWHERKLLPLADGPVVNGLPTWRRRTFLAWAFREGFTVPASSTVDGRGLPLPCHKEAAKWAHEVDLETVRPLRDLERRAARVSA